MRRTHALHRELLGQVLAAMGVGSTLAGLPACSGDSASGEPFPADGSSGPDAVADVSSPPPMDDARAEPGRESPIVIKPPPVPPVSDADIDAGRFCRELVVRREQTRDYVVCPSDAGIDAGEIIDPRYARNYTCLPAPPAGQSCSDAYSESCILNTYSCGLSQWAQRVRCGPLPAPDGQCCYVTEGTCPVGRPFFVDGVARLAHVASDPTWAVELRPEIDALDATTRAALADAWAQDGLAEHASVASFSRFVLQCLAVGAPADIVQGAQQACADEIEHARIAFGLASAYGGHPVGPGHLDVAGAIESSLDATDIACGVAAEGCIAELVSASLIAAARDEARDPAVRSALTKMADQELEHALLAWRYLAWAYRTGDDRLRTRVARIFDRMHAHVGFGARTALVGDAVQMRAHGYLPIEERRHIAEAALTNVIRPAARALLAFATPSPRAPSSERLA